MKSLRFLSISTAVFCLSSIKPKKANSYQACVFAVFLAAAVLLFAPPSGAWDAVLRDSDNWRISLNQTNPGAYYTLKYTGLLEFNHPYSYGYPYTAPVFASMNRRSGHVLIMTTERITSEHPNAGSHTPHMLIYSLDWVSDNNLHGPYGYLRGRASWVNNIVVGLVEGTMGTHSAPDGTSSSRSQAESPTDPLLNPSGNILSIALNGTDFHPEDTLEVHLRLDAALFPGERADLWVRTISPSGNVVYLAPNDTPSAATVPWKEGWLVEDIPPGSIFSGPIADFYEAGGHLFQAILTDPGASPDDLGAWITSASVLGNISADRDALGNRIIRLGALLPLTGELSSSGASSAAAIQLAVNEMNRAAQEAGIAVNVQLLMADSATSPPIANTEFTRLDSLGADIVVGPNASSSVQAVDSVARDTNLVYISATSTSTELARADDNLIRLVPDDSYQARAIAQLMAQRGITRVAILARTDTYGRSLAAELSDTLQTVGAEAFLVRHYGRGDDDPATPIAELQAAVAAELATGTAAESIGVMLVSFSEATALLEAAATDATLGSVRWYGSDGIALDEGLIAAPAAAEFAVRVGLTCAMTARYSNATYLEKEQALRDTLGYTPSPHALTYYDATWLAALAVLNAGDAHQDPEVVMTAFRSLTSSYTGATGPFELNAADDRQNGRYDFWAVVEGASGYEWSEAVSDSSSQADRWGLGAVMDNHSLLRMMGELIEQTPEEVLPEKKLADEKKMDVKLPEQKKRALSKKMKLYDFRERVVRTIGADIIELESGKLVKYIGLQDPAGFLANNGREQDIDAVYAYHEKLVSGKMVTILLGEKARDKAGLYLGHVFIEQDIFINAELIRRGYALTAEYPSDFQYHSFFIRLFKNAQDSGVGIWKY